MTRPAGSAGLPPPGLLGLYALSMMEREDRVHGYGVAERIALRTEGSWRPGPGAVYPSLRKLVDRGWARERAKGRRREYEITVEGRKLLSRFRQRQASTSSSRLDLTSLWAEVAGSEDLDSFLLMRLRRSLTAVDRRLQRTVNPQDRDREFREDLVRELSRALGRARRPPPGRRRIAQGHGRV